MVDRKLAGNEIGFVQVWD